MKLLSREYTLLFLWIFILYFIGFDVSAQRYLVKKEKVYYREYQLKPKKKENVIVFDNSRFKNRSKPRKLKKYIIRKTLNRRGGFIKETKYYPEPRDYPNAEIDPDIAAYEARSFIKLQKPHVEKGKMSSFVKDTYLNGELITSERWEVTKEGKLEFSNKQDFRLDPGPSIKVFVYALNGDLLTEYEEHIFKKIKEKSSVPLRNVLTIRKYRGRIDSSWFDQTGRITNEVHYENGVFKQRFEYYYHGNPVRLKTRLTYRGSPEKLWSLREWSYEKNNQRLVRSLYKRVNSAEIIHEYEYNKRNRLTKIKHYNQSGLRGITLVKYRYYLDELIGL